MKTLKEYLKTTPKYINLLQANGVTTMKEFLQYFPRTYEDRKNMVTLHEMQSEEIAYSVKVHVQKKILIKTPRGKRIIELQAVDTTWEKTSINFFHANFLMSTLKTDQRYIIIGKPKKDKNKIVFRHPEMIPTEAPEQTDEETTGEGDAGAFNVGRMYPIYPEFLGISPVWFAKKMRENLSVIPELFHEHLPKEILEKHDLMDIPTMVRQLHYPDSAEMVLKAQERLYFDRLLQIQLASLLNKQAYQTGHTFSVSDAQWMTVTEIIDRLPFTLTNAQKKSLKQIIDDIHLDRPMLRLLQGDVGSGKTIVAAIAAYYVMKEMGWQSVFLAPLEVLAQQHYRSLAALLLPLGVRIELITGSVSKAQKDELKKKLQQGLIDIVVGTHALLQEGIWFKNLVLAVIDEQHKFWVRQRAFFKQFWSPHILQMTATPIPRSMALAFFGEFDVSTIDEMPQWRKPIYTKIISESEYKKLKQRVLTRISQWQKVFMVVPLIEESEKMELSSATEEYHNTVELYPELQWKIWLLHGKMKPKDKDAVMKQFKEWKIVFLVSTTVIEVGIDVPEATVMIIKNAERFGLAQLHQLRWRVWRNELQSYCFLETKYKSWDAYKRLQALEKTHNGFKLAEMDMQIRGTGEILGVRQSGDTDIPVSVISNIQFLEKVQSAAHRLLENYPDLKWLDELRQSLGDNMWNILA